MKFFLLFFAAYVAAADDGLPELASLILSNRPPQWLSETRAFQNVADLTANEAFFAYDLNVPFWSDGAVKRRWIFLPAGKKIQFSPTNEWTFPAGTLFMKQFDFETPNDRTQRLETRFTVVTATGGVVGVTYRWRNNTNAELQVTNSLIALAGRKTQPWYVPSREDCVTCHTPLNGGVLGVNTRQLNRRRASLNGGSENQLVVWRRRGMFVKDDAPFVPSDFASLAEATDENASITHRARSWLDVNCANCHRPGGTVATFDARFDTPLSQQGLVNGLILIDEGIDSARVIAPNDVWRSILLLRVNTREPFKMPPIARECVDTAAVALLRRWIESLPGPNVLGPPKIFPAGGDFAAPVRVTLTHDHPHAAIHFTLDGTSPGRASPLYTTPIELTEPTTVRARAFEPEMTKSIAVQETFIVTGAPPNSSDSTARR
jgi:uncharacterized repeat protein (TIGR03806 family)